MIKGMKKMQEYKEGQNCPACDVGKLKMIGGDIEKRGKGHLVSIFLECISCTEKFLDEKRVPRGALLKKV